MNIKPHDYHMILNAQARSLKLFDATGKEVFQCEARNRTVNNGQWGHWGNCPPGEYVLGKPVFKDTVPFGRWFIPLLDYGDHHTMAKFGRSGIGIHGGGSGLARPMAPRQSPPWVVTHGCFRILNLSLAELEQKVAGCQANGGTVYVTVVADVPGAVVEADDWLLDTELAEDE